MRRRLLGTRATALRAAIDKSPSRYAVGRREPELVTDFVSEVYRYGGGKSNFDTVFDVGTTTSLPTSARTMFDSDGLLKWGPHNLSPRSEDFGTGWTPAATTVATNQIAAPDGTGTADKLTDDGTNADHHIRLAISTAGGLIQHTVAIWMKAGTHRYVSINVAVAPQFYVTQVFDLVGGVLGEASVGSNGSTIENASITDAGNGWYLCVVDYILNISSTGHTILFDMFEAATGNSFDAFGRNTGYDGNELDFYLWGVHVYRSDLGGMANNPDRGDSYVPTTSAAKYLFRRGSHTYDVSSWKDRGIFVETEERTNLIVQSNAFTTTWTDVNATPASGASTGPDGTSSMWNLVDDGATGTGEVYLDYGVTVSTSTAYTFSVFVKANALSWVALGTENFTTPANGESFFNLSTGAKGTAAAGHTLHLEDIGGGIYRVGITFTTDGADTAGNVRIYVSDGDTDTTVDLDGTSSVYVFGAQFEVGSTPSSYIPTAGATVTRAADALTIPAAKMSYSATAMSFQMDGLLTYADEAVSEQEIFFDWYVDAQNYIRIELSGDAGTGRLGFRQEVGNVLDVALTADNYFSPGVNVPFNVAMRNTAGAINGAEAGTALTENATPASLVDLSSTDFDFCDEFMGHISTFRQWNVDLGDAGIAKAAT